MNDDNEMICCIYSATKYQLCGRGWGFYKNACLWFYSFCCVEKERLRERMKYFMQKEIMLVVA